MQSIEGDLDQLKGIMVKNIGKSPALLLIISAPSLHMTNNKINNNSQHSTDSTH